MDGPMVAAFLTDHGVGVDDGGAFAEDAFANWIAAL
jgi:hypothetical protein